MSSTSVPPGRRCYRCNGSTDVSVFEVVSLAHTVSLGSLGIATMFCHVVTRRPSCPLHPACHPRSHLRPVSPVICPQTPLLHPYHPCLSSSSLPFPLSNTSPRELEFVGRGSSKPVSQPWWMIRWTCLTGPGSSC